MAGKCILISLILGNIIVIMMNSSLVSSRAADDTWYNIGPGSKDAINRVDVLQNLSAPAIGPSTAAKPVTPVQPTKPVTPAQPAPTTTPPGQPLPPVNPGSSAGEQSPKLILPNPAPSSESSNTSKVISMNDFVAVGCFRDSYVEPRPLPKLITDLRDDSKNASRRGDFNNTILTCARDAFKLGFSFFGIQAEGECWSGESAGKTYKRDGASTDCHNGVGRSGSNFVYKFIGAYAKACKDCGPPRAMCFPASATLRLKNADVISMKELKIGDEVQTLDPTANQIISTQVIAFLHKDVGTEKYRVIEAENGFRVILSDKHLIYAGKSTHVLKMIFADRVKPGDYILSGKKPSEVTKVETMNGNGVYAPLTRHGTMLVDGVYVSCYAHWSNHEVAHQVMAPLRLWHDISNAVTKIVSRVVIKEGTISENGFRGIHTYANLLLKLLRYLPSNIPSMFI